MNKIDLFDWPYSEEECFLFLKNYRMKEGIHCKSCKQTRHGWLEKRKRFICLNCKKECTIRSGTAMEYSKLPLRYWVLAMLYMASMKKPISAAALQRILKHKYYEPIWVMLHKIRITMGHRLELYCQDYLKEYGKVDILVVHKSNIKKRVSMKPVKVTVKIGISSGVCNLTNNTDSRLYVQMHTPGRVLEFPGQRKNRPSKYAFNSIKGCFNKLQEKFTKLSLEEILKEKLKRAGNILNIIVLNANRNLHGIYHRVSYKYIQNYLCEYCYITNRRFDDIDKTERLIKLLVSKPWYSNYFPPEEKNSELNISGNYGKNCKEYKLRV